MDFAKKRRDFPKKKDLDLLREVKNSFGRFMAIFSIVLIGVSFFAGVCAAPHDMRATADRYFDDNALCDIRLVSTIGFTDGDLDAICVENGLKGVFGAHTLDVLVRKNPAENEVVAALTSIPEDLTEGNENYLNRFRILDGRLPEKADECVVRASTARSQPLSVGDKLHLSSGTSDPLEDSLTVTELTVVGIVYVPTSISFGLGSSTIGNGSVSYLVWLPESAFLSEYYTNVFVTVDGAADADTFSDAYFDRVAPVKEALEDLGKERIAARTEEIRAEVVDTVTEEVTREVTEKVTEEVEKAVKEGIEDTVLEEVEKAVREGIEDTVRAEVEKAVREGIESATLEAVQKAVREGIESATMSVVRSEVRKGVESAVRSGVEEKVREGIEEAVRTAVQAEVKSRIEADTRAAVTENVKAAIAAQVREQVTAQVTAAVEADPMSAYLTPEQKAALIAAQVEAAYPAAYAQAEALYLEPQVAAAYPAALEQAMSLYFDASVEAAYPAALQQALSENFQKTVDEQYPAALEMALADNFEKTVEKEYPAALEKAMSENFEKTVEKEYPAALEKAMTENFDKTVDEEYSKALETAMEENFRKTVDEEYPAALETAMEENFQKTVDEKVPEEIEKVLQDTIDEVTEEQLEEILDGADKWKWYVLDRNSQESYVQYRDAADQMAKIAMIFPVFFLFVAALVCFTTMTRMVAEQRQLIGTYKALGYGTRAIASRYILYALSASLMGGVLGCIIGMQVFPLVIFNAWGIAYQMPSMVHANNLGLCVLSVAGMCAVVVLAAFSACISTLREVPSELMRPKAPKIGRKVLLERIPFIWRRISFARKVTIRNIFRYKKRFFMTLAGVAGCTGLLVTGFGISDSIGQLVTKQFGEIFRYDATVSVKEEEKNEEDEDSVRSIDETYEWIASTPGFTDTLFVSTTSGAVNVGPEADNGQEDIGVTIVALGETDTLGDFFSFRKAGSRHEAVQLADDGILLSRRTAEMLEVGEGDECYLENRDGTRKKVRISAVIEFYVGHYVYMTEELYETVFEVKASKNTVLCAADELTAEDRDAIGEMLMEDDAVTGVGFFSVNVKNINKMISALRIITVVLIISSGLLAFVVLYNLSNVNISERLREIATIKVLGFYDPEVNAYVLRETIAITVIGALVGIPVGIAIHHMIMGTIAMDAVSFGKYIAPVSYLYSVLLTVAFALIVSVFINVKLKKIPMVESLKSVE